MPRLRFAGCGTGARWRDGPGLACLRTEASFDNLDCGAKGQAMRLQQCGGAAVAIADDGSQHDTAIDVIATAARGCRGRVQDASQLI